MSERSKSGLFPLEEPPLVIANELIRMERSDNGDLIRIVYISYFISSGKVWIFEFEIFYTSTFPMLITFFRCASISRTGYAD